MRSILSVLLTALLTSCSVAEGATGKPHIVSSWSAEQGGEQISLTDILRNVDIGAVAASPDGRWVAFVTRSADVECDCFHHRLRVVDLSNYDVVDVGDLGEPFRSVAPNGQPIGSLISPQPMWSRDSSTLAFFYNMRAAIGIKTWSWRRPKAVSDLKTAYAPYAFAWSQRPSRADLIYLTSESDVSGKNEAHEKRDGGLLYGPAFAGVPPGSLPKAAEIPSANEWVAAGSGAAEAAISQGTLRVYNLDKQSDEPATPDDTAEFVERPVSSAYESIVTRPGVQSAESDETAACRGFAPAARWRAKSGERIFVCSERGGRWTSGIGEFYLIDKKTHVPRRWFDTYAPGVFDGVMGQACDLAGDSIICVVEDPASPPCLVLIRQDGRRRVLFDPNSKWRSRKHGRIEKLVWSNSFGASTWAFLTYPSAYRRGVPLPLVIVQYDASGFQRAGTGSEYPIFPIAESGFLVLSLEHPLAPGESRSAVSDIEKHTAQWENNAWQRSIQSSIDIVVDDLVDRGVVDRQRVAYTGFSGGANQIDFALSNGRKMATAITSNCCIGPESWPSTAANLFYSDFLRIVGLQNPAQGPRSWKSWAPTSPSMHVTDINTPILANSAQSEMLSATTLWARMKLANVPMELVVFPDEAHVKTRPLHRAAIFACNIDWLRFWLLGQEDQDSEKREQYKRWRHLEELWKTGPKAASR